MKKLLILIMLFSFNGEGQEEIQGFGFEKTDCKLKDGIYTCASRYSLTMQFCTEYGFKMQAPPPGDLLLLYWNEESCKTEDNMIICYSYSNFLVNNFCTLFEEKKIKKFKNKIQAGGGIS